MKKTLIALSLLIMLFACETDVALEFGPHTPVLVVNGMIAVGDTFSIAVGKTTNARIVETDNLYVNNAIAVLYENGVEIDTLDPDPVAHRYTSPLIAVAGRTYKIVVQAPGFTTVEGTAVASSIVNTTIKSYEKEVRTDADGTLLSDIVFSIDDPQSERNFYYVEISAFYTTYFCTYSYDPAVEQFQGDLDPFETGSCIGNDELLLHDRLFDGRVKDIAISADAYALQEGDDGVRILRPYIKKYTVSQDHYNYIRDGIAANSLDGNPFAEPRITKGNIRNGYGLFAVYSVTVDTLR
jgi:hypothetical protein